MWAHFYGPYIPTPQKFQLQGSTLERVDMEHCQVFVVVVLTLCLYTCELICGVCGCCSNPL